ncbi:MAG: hypothetical protein KGJ62_08165 [Armatimonadetes bacterium]|nr:hypothetical protein [Armatimonadota bacterium]MDE2205251.1 hypothetical protein [Armatimonadota bacterium]
MSGRVACSAGDLVEQTSDLTGQSWSTSALYLRGMGCGSSIYRRNSEWHLFDAGGTAGVITDGSANVLSNNLYDAFGVLMYASGSAATQWRFQGRFVEEVGLVASAGGGGDMLVGRGVALSSALPGRIPDCGHMSPGACFLCLTAIGVPCDKARALCGAHTLCLPPPGPRGCGFLESFRCWLMCGSRGVTACMVNPDGLMDCQCGEDLAGGPDMEDPDGGAPGGPD